MSAGAAFATQFHVAYSSEILGSGTWAGIPYGCASLQLMNCMYGFIDVLDLIRKTENVESAGRIDLTSNLDNDRCCKRQRSKRKSYSPIVKLVSGSTFSMEQEILLSSPKFQRSPSSSGDIS